jgi:predicted adenine nucleotide alpha hydrolase (AANH) superfamily ATPase
VVKSDDQVKVLLHVCCGLCLAGPVEALRAEGRGIKVFFHNPNIHPLIEFRRRLKSAAVAADALKAPILIDETYGLEAYLESVDWKGPKRCLDCYDMRLSETARKAVEGGFDEFTTTLLTSTHQDHKAIREAGKRAEERFGVSFLYRDWRGLCDASNDLAGRLSLYRQQYCGCIFSEYERYRDTNLHRYKGAEKQ